MIAIIRINLNSIYTLWAEKIKIQWNLELWSQQHSQLNQWKKMTLFKCSRIKKSISKIKQDRKAKMTKKPMCQQRWRCNTSLKMLLCQQERKHRWSQKMKLVQSHRNYLKQQSSWVLNKLKYWQSICKSRCTKFSVNLDIWRVQKRCSKTRKKWQTQVC